ncbi:hypothetical protein TorRG33x02_051420 [Trema orientale]|uniref:Uncharacterized protein n=1 Tax=Trema orientale TaxID=63057 RepID=A0A2P5FM80_TREOI|nr:hypothetical protein TorRG33x02_051420 [Trema orientale]
MSVHGNPTLIEVLLKWVSEELGNFPFLDHCQILDTEKLSPLLPMLIFFPSASPSIKPFLLGPLLPFTSLKPLPPPPSPTPPPLLCCKATCNSESATTYWYDPIE